MNLKHLLAVGRSFIGMRTDATRYKVVEPSYIPRFEGGADGRGNRATRPAPEPPSARGVRKRTRGPEPDIGSVADDASRSGTVGSSGTVPAAEAAPVPADVEAGPVRPVAEPAATVRAPGAVSEPPGRSARRRGPARRVLAQAELSFEAVRVVRNDLALEDVRIVQAGRGGARADREAVAVRGFRELPPQGWGAWRERASRWMQGERLTAQPDAS